MAVLKNHKTGEKIILRSHHTFGRKKAGTDTFLESKDVSQIHASIRWEGSHWKILDHSRNGTWIDGVRLIKEQSLVLKAGNIIRFGGAEQSAWKVTDLGPPIPVLVPIQDNVPVIELERFHVLPDEENPEISIYISEKGQWVCENENGVVALNDGDLVHHHQKIWQFFSAGAVDTTLEAREESYYAIEKFNFNFEVSTDEEHVFLKIQQNSKSLDLGERAHHYLLLTLARQRLEDAKNKEDRSSQGWIDLEQLSQMLNLDPEHLNIQIFRARKQVSQALPETFHLPQVVERRVGSVRFGCPSFQIFRGSTLEGKVVHEELQDDLLV